MFKIYMEEREERIKGRRHRRKQARIARTRREILRYTLLLALLVAGVGAFVKVSWSVVDPDADIIVAGNDVTSAKQIRRVLLPALKKPIYALNPKQLEQAVESLPDVQRAFVRRYLLPRPHLVVHVMEEFPWASFAQAANEPVSHVISQTGRFIPVAQFPGIQLPALRIYGNKSELSFNETQVALWSNWVNFISAQTAKDVDFVDMRNPKSVELQSGDLHLRLGSPDSLLSKRLARLPSLLPVLATLKKENIDYVDLSFDSNVPLKISKTSKKEELMKGGQAAGHNSQAMDAHASAGENSALHNGSANAQTLPEKTPIAEGSAPDPM